MITMSDIELMRSEEFRGNVLRNIERDPVAVALDKHIPNAQLVATQVKYLQRARHKLPSLYKAGCIIPPRAFEQSSSEDSASVKPLQGESLLDLTCGLGIDTMAFARRFKRVVTIERDAILAEVVRHNLRLLGVDNVEVVTASSEEFIASCNDHFDWVFADPDRRSLDGKKLVCMEDCSPNVLALMPQLSGIAGRIGLKLSPLFDVEEAFRLFPGSEVEVVSIGGECKELNIYTNAERELLRIVMVGVGTWTYEHSDMRLLPSDTKIDVERVKYLIAPDVALQKSRVAVAAFRDYASISSNNGYAFAEELVDERIPGRVYDIVHMERYNPKSLKREFRGVGVELLKRDSSLSIDAVRRATGMRAGSERMMALTTINNENWIIEIKPL